MMHDPTTWNTFLAALLHGFKRHRWLLMLGAVSLGVATGILYLFLQPPPHRLVMSVGNSSGVYRNFAVQYAALLAKKGITLELHPSSGAIENYQRLKDPSSIYDVALVQSGIGNVREAPHLEMLASVSYEAIWLFYRGAGPIDKLSQLAAKRVGIGMPGSGLHRLTRDLLALSGVTKQTTELVELSAQDAEAALRSGAIDAAFFIGGPESPLIDRLLKSDARAMNFSQADAILRKFPSLSKVIFPRGAVDLARDFPPDAITLLSTTSLLVMKDRVSPTLAYALLDAAFEVHRPPGFFSSRSEFPNQRVEDFPSSEAARTYFKSGRPFLQNYLPFWLANLIEQHFVVLVPLLAAVFALVRAVPYAIDHRTRSRLAHWYGSIRRLDDEMRSEQGASLPQLKRWQHELDAIDTTVHRLNLPRRHFDQIVALKLSIHLLKERIRRLAETTSAD